MNSQDVIEEFEIELKGMINNPETNRLYIWLLEYLEIRLKEIKTKHSRLEEKP